eukprot:9092277-Pyramimonas_sp.AAC.1
MASCDLSPRWPLGAWVDRGCWPPRGRLRYPVAFCGCAFAGASPTAALPLWIMMVSRALLRSCFVFVQRSDLE